ncbi:MAG: dehypoxanthine futalosine cyclase [Bacteroidales bacterium]|nr:dehypoxanthine futalosine cyclase [Bacteroidales bacterium]
MSLVDIYKKAFELEDLSLEEALILYKEAPTSELLFLAHELRKKHKKDDKKVGWIIDRNVNITNVCIAQCKFCNFCRTPKSDDAYVTNIEQYKVKIDEMYRLGGRQLLLQGGLHPDLGLAYYVDLFERLKIIYPDLKLNALSPSEIVHISNKEGISYSETLKILMKAGLDSLPGAGAEILSERVRKIVSPAKCTVQQWLDVMKEAHLLNLPTSATMMFGFIETIEGRIEHLFALRNLQAQKPVGNYGFVIFIPWPYQPEYTKLQQMYPELERVSAIEYMRLVAISRIVLNNIENIQSSWLTVGKDVAQLTLFGGANDLGSIMIEENVVSAAGAEYSMNSDDMTKAILEAGFEPVLRNQKYEFL